MGKTSGFLQARTDFLAHLRYGRGRSKGTCYAYSSDLGIWRAWLKTAGHDWCACTHVEVEGWITWQMRERQVQPHIVARRSSCLSTFYKWALKNGLVQSDPVYLADKPKKPYRLPVWLERDEQDRLQAAAQSRADLPANIFGRTPERLIEVRQRYEVLFGLIQNSGLRLSEALGLKVRDVTLAGAVARKVRVIGKGNKERVVPLPEAFGLVFGAWVVEMARDDFVFAKAPGDTPPTPQVVRTYLKGLVARAKIDKKITPHKLRHTYATRVLESGAALVDIQALLGHANLATTQIYTHVDEDRMAAVVAKL
ncbi:MAG: tyrosine-type recombinase/integrase [Azonexus sp.]